MADTPFEQEFCKALMLATKAHKGQKDISGEDYILHPITVSVYCITEKGKIAALLHDVVEDTDVTLDDLRAAGFGDDIVTAVDCLSKRKDEAVSHYLERVASNDIAAEVKFADMRHNGSRTKRPIDSPKGWVKKNYKKYNKRSQQLFTIVGAGRAAGAMSEETYEWVTGPAPPDK